MKQTIFFLATLFLLNTMQAQSVKLGLRAGLHLSNYRASSASATQLKDRFGFDAAFLSEFRINRLFSIQAEAGYATYGIRYKEVYKVKYNQGYVVVPVLLKFNTTEGLSVFAGPQLGVLVAAKSQTSDSDESVNLKEYLKENDFFVVTGAEYDLKNGFSIGVRYSHGVSNINRDNPELSVKNRGLGFSVAYRLAAGAR
ncbi:MAG TPA: porin family protein [Chitinophagaceae bacterium]|nr:porin family protein [Chitinophagaceae bacterium]